MKAFLPGIVLCALLGLAFYLGSNRDLLNLLQDKATAPPPASSLQPKAPNPLPNLVGVENLQPIQDSNIIQIQALIPKIPTQTFAHVATGQVAAATDYEKIDEDGIYVWGKEYRGQIYLKGNICVVHLPKTTTAADAKGVVQNLYSKEEITVQDEADPPKLFLTFKTRGKRYSLKFKADNSSLVNIFVPSQGVSLPPQIVSAVNGEYDFPTILPNPISVFNRYLKIKYRNETSGSSLKAILFKKVGQTPTAISSPIPVSSTVNGVTGDFTFWPLPVDEPATGQYELFLVSELQDGNTSNALKPLTLSMEASVIVNSPNPIKLNKESSTTLEFDTNEKSLVLNGFTIPAYSQVFVYKDPNFTTPIATAINNTNAVSAELTSITGIRLPELPDGIHHLFMEYRQGNQRKSERSSPITIRIKTRGPKVLSVTPTTIGSVVAADIIVRFDSPLNASTIDNFAIEDIGEVRAKSPIVLSAAAKPQFGEDHTVVRIPITATQESAGSYRLRVKGRIKDEFGNELEGNFSDKGTDYLFDFSKGTAVGEDAVSLGRGITTTTGKYVPFTEYTRFRKSPSGFNPGDHVETRVVRLYYFRDAHRVSQIINRNVKSYNTPAIAVRERLADQSRDKANVLTDQRRVDERAAVIAAEASRLIEHQLANAQRDLASARQQQDSPNATTAQKQDASARITELEGKVRGLQGDLQSKRQAEIVANEKALSTTTSEDRAREEQFRRQTAAARTDPDTYVPGEPDSQDPVQQVSISVIGEATIQLRGPTSGMNIIRKMIHEIDSPVGQVRIAMHTVQVNGEHGDRMEKVVAKIQDHIDQSRFLTVTSSLMLRKSIVRVASQRAMAAEHRFPEASQEARNEKYLYAFFGKDFIDELKTLDSEFLRTGNKLLSLHSMDTTSLAAGLFVLSLAKNTTRQEILADFRRQLECELPVAEMNFVNEGGYRKHAKCTMLLGGNAKFQSFFGFFDADILGDDTLTPMQREFIRLAQIFKSQLVTELELKQRVMERALLEDRIGDDIVEELQKQKKKEDDARAEVGTVQRLLSRQLETLSSTVGDVFAEIQSIHQQNHVIKTFVADIHAKVVDFAKQSLKQWENVSQKQNDKHRQSQVSLWSSALREGDFLTALKVSVNEGKTLEANSRSSRLRSDLSNISNKTSPYNDIGRLLKDAATLGDLSSQIAGENNLKDVPSVPPISLTLLTRTVTWDVISEEGKTYYKFKDDGAVAWNEWMDTLDQRSSFYEVFPLAKTGADGSLTSKGGIGPIRKDLVKLKVKAIGNDRLEIDQFSSMVTTVDSLYQITTRVEEETNRLLNQSLALLAAFQERSGDPRQLFARWIAIRNEMLIKTDGSLKARAQVKFAAVDSGFLTLLERNLQVQQKQQELEASRRPLDHKKFLDLLIDEMQDKYVELLEGTRSYLANIDDYIKRVASALEDDFNRQFYQPAFREVRAASRMWDVTLGQIETTSILTNNRGFGKVEPQATMEFDLPRRDIFVTEAMKTSKGLVDTYGALLQDPTFISLSKLNSGMPTSTPQGGSTSGMPSVRNVLPGMSRSSDETLLSQGPPATRSGASPLDQLIPDPAIYKFETGTGYEVRPVIGPDGQSVTFHLNYMYTTNVREPVRADEKHLGRVKRHFIDTDVQIGNYELREVSRYQVALKASRTAKGVPLLQDIPGLGIMFRPLPSAESSLQQNVILSQAVIYPTLFDLMGLRWAPVVADLDPLALRSADFVVRQRKKYVMYRVFDTSTGEVDSALRIPENVRRGDLYRAQETIPYAHPNGYQGPGLGVQDSHLRPGYDAQHLYPQTQFGPTNSINGVPAPNGGAMRMPAGFTPEMPYGVPGGPTSVMIPRSGVSQGSPVEMQEGRSAVKGYAPAGSAGLPTGPMPAKLVPQQPPTLPLGGTSVIYGGPQLGGQPVRSNVPTGASVPLPSSRPPYQVR